MLQEWKYLFKSLVKITFVYISWNGISGFMITILFLIFWGPSPLFSIVDALFSISTNSAQGFPFLHTLVYIFIFCYIILYFAISFFIIAFPTNEGSTSLWFWSAFPWWCWILFHVPINHLYVSFWKYLYSSLLPILKFCGFFLLMLSYINSFHILDINSLSEIWLAIFSPTSI